MLQLLGQLSSSYILLLLLLCIRLAYCYASYFASLKASWRRCRLPLGNYEHYKRMQVSADTVTSVSRNTMHAD